jgi:hypothetical protein
VGRKEFYEEEIGSWQGKWGRLAVLSLEAWKRDEFTVVELFVLASKVVFERDGLYSTSQPEPNVSYMIFKVGN